MYSFCFVVHIYSKRMAQSGNLHSLSSHLLLAFFGLCSHTTAAFDLDTDDLEEINEIPLTFHSHKDS